MAFDPHDEKVVRMELPFWLLRLKWAARASTSAAATSISAKLRLTVEDLERYGPMLILDQKDTDGSRVLVWSQ